MKRISQVQKLNNNADAIKFVICLSIDFVLGYLASELISKSGTEADKWAHIVLFGADQVVLNLRLITHESKSILKIFNVSFLQRSSRLLYEILLGQTTSPKIA